MHIYIRGSGLSLTRALRNHAEARLRFAFAKAGGRVGSIVIRLAWRSVAHGVSHRCTVRALLPGIGPVVVEQHEDDAYRAIDRAADRAGRAAIRRLQKAAVRPAPSEPMANE